MKNKTHFLSIAVLILIMAASCSPSQRIASQNGHYNDEYYEDDEAYIQPQADVNYQMFYNELSPYGNWIDYPSYGRVWIANERNFIPYATAGRWAYTNFGWTWVSDYRWGWAPFHYGRWSFDNRYGWFWVPGYDWAPAWVNWRGGGDYYGWSPMQPGVNMNYGFGRGIPDDRWIFVNSRYINSPYMHNYIVPRSQNGVIVNNTTVINNVNVYNNTRYAAGPEKTEVEKFTGKTIRPQRLVTAETPGADRLENNAVHVYRPKVANNNVTTNSSTNNTIDRLRARNNKNSLQRKPEVSNDNEENSLNSNRTNINRQRIDRQSGRPVTPPSINSSGNATSIEIERRRRSYNNSNETSGNTLNNNNVLRRRRIDNYQSNTDNSEQQRRVLPQRNNTFNDQSNQMDNRRPKDLPTTNPQFNRNTAPIQRRLNNEQGQNITLPRIKRQN